VVIEIIICLSDEHFVGIEMRSMKEGMEAYIWRYLNGRRKMRREEWRE